MNETRNITIAVLSISAVILAVVLAFAWNTDRSYADASVAAGDYVMFTGQVTAANDLLYVIDRTTFTVNTYEFNSGDGTLRLLDQVDLGKEFGKTGR